MGRRLLQRLEEGGGGRLGEHVCLVDDVYLAPGFGGRVLHLFPQVANVVDAPVAGGVDLDDVHRPTLVYGRADGAGVVRFPGLWRQAVHGLGENAGGAGLAGAAGPAEQVGVSDAADVHGSAQGPGGDRLAHNVGERGRSPFPVKHLTHAGYSTLIDDAEAPSMATSNLRCSASMSLRSSGSS